MSLCYRCEWRAQYHEKGHAPRCECGQIEASKIACYMYRPVSPCILEQLNKDDPRPVSGPPMLAGRSKFVGISDARIVMRVFNNGKYTFYRDFTDYDGPDTDQDKSQ
jgi:hypothetical protein